MTKTHFGTSLSRPAKVLLVITKCAPPLLDLTLFTSQTRVCHLPICRAIGNLVTSRFAVECLHGRPTLPHPAAFSTAPLSDSFIHFFVDLANTQGCAEIAGLPVAIFFSHGLRGELAKSVCAALALALAPFPDVFAPNALIRKPIL